METYQIQPGEIGADGVLNFLAQVPSPIVPRTPEQPIPTLPTPQPDPLPELTPAPVTPEVSPDISATISVKEFVFEGNTAFSDQRLAEVTQPFTGRAISFAELLQAEAAVSRLYREAGYINTGAFIPADQTLTREETTVRIQVVEGGVEDIVVRGTRRLKPGYIRSRLAIATKKPLNQNRLLEALQMLQLNPLIENLSAELSAGARPELSLLEIDITEAPAFNVEAFIDNGRAPSVGSFRRGINLNHANLFGLGDNLNFEYTNTDGSDAFDLTYAVPINPRNGTISFSARFTDTKVVEPPFDRIDITGDSRYFDLSFRQPIIQTPTRELTLGITGSREESQTQLLGEDFPLSAGANDDGETRVSAIRFFQEFTQRTSRDVFAARSQFSLGIDLFDATVNSDPPDGRFFSWRGQAQYVRLLAPETLLVVRSDAQLAPRALVPLEQFGVGGLRSVRGYRQDLLLTDNGFLASAEVRFPILRVSDVEGVLQVVPFVDFGVGWNSSDNPDPDPNSLVGIGFGLLWEMGDRFSARLDWGIPLTDVDSSDRTWQESGVYFSVNYNFLRF